MASSSAIVHQRCSYFSWQRGFPVLRATRKNAEKGVYLAARRLVVLNAANWSLSRVWGARSARRGLLLCMSSKVIVE